MSQRYATIIKADDGSEVVSSIAQIEGRPPEVRNGENAKVVKAPDGVKIGMIKGGTVDAVGGYGFPDGSAPKAKVEDKDEG